MIDDMEEDNGVMKNKEIVKKQRTREIPTETSTNVLHGTKDFAYAIDMAESILIRNDDTLNEVDPSMSVEKQQLSTRKDKIPLIIVPSAPTAKITLFNVKKFLENSIFEDARTFRAQGMKKPEYVTVERVKRNGQVVVYDIVDSVAKFSQSDWNRVCCVFVGGQAWQFIGWKYENPFELFLHVKGVFPKWSDEKVSGKAAHWVVTPLDIHRHQRHRDKLCVSQFWDMLDKYNQVNKRFLNF
ncbi:RNA polymerase II accessory factor [Phascolomyces articulosus]|uniref:RNA polymerase II accessory factor n=1 Tax=Phascolomyces articulosus TaxID=60185 RepID=A0AAD5KBK2_9FUNG|nr:RNA polymerase II accessory factor [Phascolomyces articulosus]